PHFYRRPFVVTIHDDTRFIFPGQKRQDLKQQLAYEYVFTKTIARARDVVYVSATTHDDARRLPVKITGRESIIKEAVDDYFFTPVSSDRRQKVRMLLGSPDPYLLYVGVWMNHKNLARLIEAFAQVAKDYPQLKLVMTGKPIPGYSNVVKIAQKFQIADRVIFLGFIPDELLPALYAEAVCCTF
ncbi:MAG: glycosyltransferase, partial [Candidatus Andersenbacteria bacterium]